MSTKMTSLPVFWFFQEIVHQCLFVRMAVEDIISCRTADTKGLCREYYYIQILLSAVGAISKILWPIERSMGKKLIELRRARGNELRQALNVKDDSPLKNRELRDIFEHFDERMDEWFQKTERRGFSDRNIGSFERVLMPPPSERLRIFISQTWTVIYCDKEFRLSPAIRAVHSLYDEVQHQTCKPGRIRKLFPDEIISELDEANNAPHK